MKFRNSSWKVPVALGMVVCSLVPVCLLYFIDAIDFSSSERAFKHLPPPRLAYIFQDFYQVGLILPILTLIVAVWFVLGKSIADVRLTWAVLFLVVLHLFWLAWGILAFYLANQNFVMF